MWKTTKYFFLIIHFFLICSNLVAQKPEWIRNSEIVDDIYGETNGKRVVIHPDGSLFVIGQYKGENIISGWPLNAYPNTLDDGFLAKYTADGDLLWVKQLFQSEDTYSNRLLDIKVDNTGDLIFSGSCLWPSTVLGSDVGVGQFIAKIDIDGNLLWINFAPLAGGTLAEHSRRGNRIAFDNGNNIYWLTDQINEFEPSGAIVIEKYTSDGANVKSIPITRSPTFYRPSIRDFTVDGAGNFIVSGNFQKTVAFVNGPLLTNNGSNFNPIQFFVAKFNKDGQYQWVVNSQSSASVLTRHITDNNGNIFLSLSLRAGAKIHTTDEIQEISNEQSVIVSLNNEGQLEWIKSIYNTNIDDLFMAPDGLIYITGTNYGEDFRYQSYFRKKQDSSAAAIILKINKEGNFYGLYIGESVDEPATIYGPRAEAYQSVVDDDGNIYTIGGFFDRQVWGCISAIAKEYSFFLTKHTNAISPIRTIEGPSIFCEGDEINLSTDLISNGVLYKWFLPEMMDEQQPSLPLNNGISFIAKPEDDGKIVVVSITDDCDEYFAEPFILNIKSLPKEPILNVYSTVVCPGNSYEYQIQEIEESVNYHWIFSEDVTGQDLVDKGGQFLFDDDFKEGNIRVVATNDCGSRESILYIQTHPVPEIPEITGSQTICPGIEYLQVFSEPVFDALYYEWELPEFISFDTDYDQNLTTLYAIVESQFEFGEIRVRAIGECESSEASNAVFVNRIPNPANIGLIEGPDEVCINSGNIKYTVDEIENTDFYVWTLPNLFNIGGIVETVEPFINVQATTAGMGAITVSGKNNCNRFGVESIMSVNTYMQLPEPILMIGDCDLSITVKNGENSSWYRNNELIASNFSDSTMMISEAGLYKVLIENFCGVQESNVVEVLPVLTSETLVPNVITVNGDGKNDSFKINESINQPSLKIMNRWGKLIYSSESYQNEWDAKDVSPGMYYIVVEHQCLPQGKYLGWLTVIK